MKNSKIYLLLIAMAFLSFSCKENSSTDDEDNDKEKDVIISKNGADYNFNIFSIYEFEDRRFIGSQELSKLESYITCLGFENYKGRSALKTSQVSYDENLRAQTTINYATSDGSKLLHSTDVFVNTLSSKLQINSSVIQSQIGDWYVVADFDKENWTNMEFSFIHPANSAFYSYTMNSKKTKEVSIQFDNKTYNGIEFLTEMILYNRIEVFGEVIENEVKTVNRITYLEGIGVYSSITLMKDNPLMSYDMEFILKSIDN